MELLTNSRPHTFASLSHRCAVQQSMGTMLLRTSLLSSLYSHCFCTQRTCYAFTCSGYMYSRRAMPYTLPPRYALHTPATLCPAHSHHAVPYILPPLRALHTRTTPCPTYSHHAAHSITCGRTRTQFMGKRGGNGWDSWKDRAVCV